MRPTDGHPIVVGKSATAKQNGKPHVLFYGHYDVQPVDPLNEWTHPPFEPRIETLPDGRKIIVARGACDDKGQAMTFVEACRAYKAVTGSLPLPITMMIEGEEECGSKHLFDFVRNNADEFKLDLALICDTSMWDQKTPAITTSLRGLVYEEVRLDLRRPRPAFRPVRRRGAESAARAEQNPCCDARRQRPRHHPGLLRRRAGIAGRREGRSQGPQPHAGEVSRPGRAEGRGRREGPHADRADRDAADRRDQRRHRRLHRARAPRPSFPARRLGKVSFRLVGQQDPKKIREAFRAFVKARLPVDCTVEFANFADSPAIQLPFDNPSLDKARTALASEWGTKAITIGAGGSIPIVGDFKSVLGMDSLMVGFALDDDRVHSPNEKFDLTSFHKGIRSWARILDALAA